MKPRDLGNGRFMVERTANFVYWCAWRDWLHRETGRTFFGEKICAWGEWPPQTLEGASMVAARVSDARRQIGWDFQACDPAQPWDRWSYNEREDFERRHREDFAWNPPLAPFRGARRPGPSPRDELDSFVDSQAAKLPSVLKGETVAAYRVRIGKGGPARRGWAKDLGAEIATDEPELEPAP